MNYAWLRRQDLELASGSVEGAVNLVIAKRFDSGGMRWIREWTEALLQLWCIDLNRDWEAILAFVQEKVTPLIRRNRTAHRILTCQLAPLPQIGLLLKMKLKCSKTSAPDSIHISLSLYVLRERATGYRGDDSEGTVILSRRTDL